MLKDYLFMHAYEFLCLVYPCMIIMINIYLLFMDDSWKKEKTLFCAKIGIVMPLLTFKFNAQIQGEFLYFLMNCQDFISKVKSYLCCHQSLKRERLKVHLDP
jgi:hypothetical protein